MLRNMQGHMEDRRLLASAALFRQLHENKKDVYDILAQFIRSSIILSSSWSFNVTECSAALLKYFGFKIPDAVIRTCLKKRLKRADELSLHQGIFTITPNFVRTDSLKDEYAQVQSEQGFIIASLIAYVEKSTSQRLSETAKQQLSEDFHSYFLGGLKPCDNSSRISEFIVKFSDSPEQIEKLNRVEEGLILYGGICHSSSLANHEPWRNDLTIFLDTEILFFSQGYNGTLHESIFNDFHGLIKEINLRSKNGAKIELRYFEETRREVEDFFYAAEKIVEQKQSPDPSKPAMLNITNGCRGSSDVLLKKARFYEALRKLRIEVEAERNYYNPPTYVIDDASTIQTLENEHPELDHDKIPDILKLFTKINYLRKGISNQGLEQSGAILVSGKNITRVLAFSNPIFKENKQIPFATDVDYLTERLWFKLNKGFSDGKLPTSFDVVARAQVILSSQAGSKVAEDYKALVTQVKDGEMTNESAAYLLSELRSRTTKPEDFRSDTIEELAEFLHSEFIENTLREKTALQQKAEAGEQSRAHIIELEDKLKRQTNTTQEHAEAAKALEDKHIRDLVAVDLKHKLELRQKDLLFRKERLRPLRLQARFEYLALNLLAYAGVAASCYYLILQLRSDNDTALTVLGVVLGLIPLTLAINSKKVQNHIRKRVRALYISRRKNQVFPELVKHSSPATPNNKSVRSEGESTFI